MSSAANAKAALRDPFLLPVCDCGGPMNTPRQFDHLTWLDKPPIDQDRTTRFYRVGPRDEQIDLAHMRREPVRQLYEDALRSTAI